MEEQIPVPQPPVMPPQTKPFPRWAIVLIILAILLTPVGFRLLRIVATKKSPLPPISPSTQISPTLTPAPSPLPTEGPPEIITWTDFTDTKQRFHFTYPSYWTIKTDYNTDSFLTRTKIFSDIKTIRLPSDTLHDEIRLSSPYTANNEKDLVSLRVYIYDNPKKLSLFEYFRGLRLSFGMAPTDDSLEDTGFSQEVTDAKSETIGNFTWKTLTPTTYSDIGNAKNINYLAETTDHATVLRLDFGYWLNYTLPEKYTLEDINKAENTLPPAVAEKINRILQSFTFK